MSEDSCAPLEQEAAQPQAAKAKAAVSGPSELPPPGPGQMPLFDHLRELRVRILRALLAVLAGFFICYFFAGQIQKALEAPLLEVLRELPGVSGKFVYTGMAEAFLVELKVALVAGFFLAAPFVFYQFWAFAAPGLYPQERRLIIPLALFTGLFFVAGASFGYFVVFPPAFKFFMSFNSESVQAMPRLAEYFGFCIQLLFAFGLVFELPLLAFFLARFGVITASMLRKFRGYALIGAFVLGALLTPPDVVSQLLMAGPLIVLYEISILVVKAVGRKQEG